MTRHLVDTPRFYLTAPAPCPYLPDRLERKVFTYLIGDQATPLNDALTQGGFRRSQHIAYRPACEHCKKCVSVRVCVHEMRQTKAFTRVWRKNSDLVGAPQPNKASAEQYSLFRDYLRARHRAGGMTQMSLFDYTRMIEDTHVQTQLIEYRRRGPDTAVSGQGEGALAGVSLTDTLGDGLSLVYSFFDPQLTQRSLGTFIILDHIRRARHAGLPYVYLGYWIEGARKMQYKARFRPQEHLGAAGWQRV